MASDHCGQEIMCETAAKSVKARLQGKESMDRGRLDQQLFIQFNGPCLLEMDEFIKECSTAFLRLYRQPLTLQSKFRTSKVIERVQREHSFLNW